MNRFGYLKFVLTALLLAVVIFGYLAVEALDRQRAATGRLLERLDRLENRLNATAQDALSAQLNPAPEKAAPNAAQNDVANREYFDPAAQIGGRIVEAIASEPPNLSALICNEATSASLNGMCSATLAERDWRQVNCFVPLLAEAWEASPDHRGYRIKLRRGVLWQNVTDPVTGKKFTNVEVTSGDFKFFVDVVRNLEVNCAPLRVYYSDLEDIEIINDYEFVVRWKNTWYGSLAATLGMSPLPRHFYDYGGKFDGRAFNDDHRRHRMIVGCGPYRFVSWEKERRMVFERNQSYFGAALGVAPPITYRVMEVIKHPNTRFLALKSGALDWVTLTPDQWLNRTDSAEFRDGRLAKFKYLSPSYSYIGYNQRNSLFVDARVRRALTMLIDREKIRRDVYRDLAEIATGPFFPGGSYFDKSLKPLPYAPAVAKKLLAEAGWRDTDGDGILEKDGRKFRFTMLQVASHPIQEKIMPIIKESLAAAGIDMLLQVVEWSVYIDRLDRRTYDACCLGWTLDFDADLYQVWHSSQREAGGSNHIGYANGELDKLIEIMRTTFDTEKRVRLAHRMARLIHEEQPYTFLFYPYTLVALSGRYRNVKVFPSGIVSEIVWVPRQLQRAVPGM